MLSAAMLLDHIEQGDAAARLRKGVFAALGDAATRTGDLGGTANTQRFTDGVIAAMG
jgi:isocitrate/isopropylmalate dehydrogenase